MKSFIFQFRIAVAGSLVERKRKKRKTSYDRVQAFEQRGVLCKRAELISARCIPGRGQHATGLCIEQRTRAFTFVEIVQCGRPEAAKPPTSRSIASEHPGARDDPPPR